MPEAELLTKINQAIPASIQNRYDQLVAQRVAINLTSDEHAELLRLSDQIEKLEASRLEYLAELARLRKVPLAALMQEFSIRPPASQ